ncbi:MAG: radical SAM protein [Clostridiales bacterium]|nr:radical SAM protein [Candidatus Equinaster intestinalis]
MSRHANISIFVPHLGCPNMCSFCNQRYIAGDTLPPSENDVKNAVETAEKSKNYNPEATEIAFFGGSFTAIEREYMESLLKAAYPYKRDGRVKGIRISTRPDAINEEILSLLKKYGVTAIELGAQSLDNEVLRANNRGHTAADIEKSSAMIRAAGFELGLQMMTGLYKSDEQKDIYTAKKTASLNPDTVRIYPTIVLEGTELEKRYKSGEYKPQNVEEAAELCVKLLEIFENAGITVIRTGLHTIDESKYVAGPWHPAFKEICDSKRFFGEIKSRLTKKGSYEISVNKRDVSRVIGQKRENIEKLKSMGFNCRVKADENIKENQFVIKECENKCC